MSAKPKALFSGLGTLGPNLDTKKLEALVDMYYHDRSKLDEVARRLGECEIAIVNKGRRGCRCDPRVERGQGCPR